MDRERTRRGVLAAILTGGVAGLAGTPASGILHRFAPASGSVWDTASDRLPDTVDSPYGEATIRYGDNGVPHVAAGSETALAFAVGYVQGADRLFQMDLQRRQMRGELSAVVGDVTLDSDRFHVAMDFLGAAEATWERVQGSDTADIVEAYVDGVNRHVGGNESTPMEYDLLGFEPSPIEPVDTFLAAKLIGWRLTGRFRTLHRETVAAELGPEVASTLYPDRLGTDVSILGHQRATENRTSDTGSDSDGSTATQGTPVGAGGTSSESRGKPGGSAGKRGIHPDLEGWLSAFEAPAGIGSNSWMVSGDHTDSGAPIVANDPHLSLMAPPVWYEMNLSGPGKSVRGVTFPGVPFVIIGENEAGAWGFTNTGADQIDFYEYETRDGEYRYGDEWREFETEERTIEVADGEDREVTVRKTVHGPMLGIESDGDDLRSAVAVAWTGLSATRTVEAVRDLNRSDGLADVREAMRQFDLPAQNFVYADRDGNTHYRVVGKVPIRRTAGEEVPGDQVFDGSAMEGEWAGFTPYGETDWEGEGFIPYEEMPHEDQPDYIGTANQRIIGSDYRYYFEKPYSAPFRGLRLWERLDRRVAGDSPVDAEFMREVQRDAYDKRAEQFVPVLLAARPAVEDGATEALLDPLEDWDYRMTRDSRAALIFARFMEHYADVVFRPRLEEGLGDQRDVREYYGDDSILVGLPPDSAWFPEGRDAAIAEALSRTRGELVDEEWETYGDYNVTTIDHPFDRSWLNYPRYPTDGSPASLNNFRKERGLGSSWRMVCPIGDGAPESRCAFPGGNDGSPFSDHYDDQLRRWANDRYKPLTLALSGDVVTRFGGGDG